MRKLLVICSTLDLALPHSATPWLWQLFKALYELGCELIIMPYRGRAIRGLWWRCYENPCELEGEAYAKLRGFFGYFSSKRNGSVRKYREGLTPRFARIIALPKWKGRVREIINKESDIEAVFFIQVPLNQIRGLASSIRTEFGLPSFYYDTDVPLSLPEFGGLYFNHFPGADLAEFEAFIIPSEGSVKRLIEMGAEKVFVLHFGVDPDVFSPIKAEYIIDVFFSGGRFRNREESIKSLIASPSKEMMDVEFVVSGRRFDVDLDLGNARYIPPIPFSSWRTYCCASRINLNIPRKNHALINATSTSRPFELAAMKCCIVSSKYLGLEKWFDLSKEMLVAESAKEAIELYTWLLSDEEKRLKLGENAYRRILKEHTAKSRAIELLGFFDKTVKR